MDYWIVWIWKIYYFKNNLYKIKKKYSNIILLDDVLRKKLKIKKTGSFSNSYRTKIGLKYVKLCKSYITNKKKFVIIAAMALISKVQIEYKKIQNNFDVYLDVPMKELKKEIKRSI